MTQGPSYPLAGIKVGGVPAHRSAKKNSPAEPPTKADQTPADTSSASPTATEKASDKASATAPAPSASETETPSAERRSTDKPATESNEVEVTTSDQISEHGLPTNGRSTTHGSSGATPTLGRGQAPDRRTAMGVASVRIAGRLTQNELGSRTGDIRTPDTSVGPDELLQLLGEYLVSGGLQNPEIHVRSNGQTIVLDLQNPAKGYR